MGGGIDAREVHDSGWLATPSGDRCLQYDRLPRARRIRCNGEHGVCVLLGNLTDRFDILIQHIGVAAGIFAIAQILGADGIDTHLHQFVVGRRGNAFDQRPRTAHLFILDIELYLTCRWPTGTGKWGHRGGKLHLLSTFRRVEIRHDGDLTPLSVGLIHPMLEGRCGAGDKIVVAVIGCGNDVRFRGDGRRVEGCNTAAECTAPNRTVVVKGDSTRGCAAVARYRHEEIYVLAHFRWIG